MRRLVLLRHATTTAVRAAAFPVDEPLDPSGETAARALAGRLGSGDARCSPALRARSTAQLAGLETQVDPDIGECDFGAWAGQTLEEVHAADPDGVRAWMTDPACAPHGGESHERFAARVTRWMDERAREDGRTVVVTHGGVVKAAVVHALGAPAEAFWRIDVAPLRLTELHGRHGRWTVVRVNAEAAP